MSRRSLLAVMTAAALILPVALRGVDKRVPIRQGDVVGTWIGLTTDELQMIRMTLGSDGRGIVGFSFLDHQPCVFRISSWTFNGGDIAIALGDSLTGCPRDRELRGIVKGNALELTLRGSGWKRNASLRKEEGLADRWRKLKAAMSDR